MSTWDTTYGNTDLWAKTFPPTLIPKILALIIEMWPLCLSKYNFSNADHETAITRRLKYFLQQAKNMRKLPVIIQREMPEEIEENNTVKEKGRIDLLFIHGFRENVYFAFECKRLNIINNGKRESLSSNYVGNEGLGAFINEWYAKQLTQAGMIGYVMDSDIDYAQSKINEKLTTMKEALKTDNGLKQSTIFPTNSQVKETSHRLPKYIMLIHHLFLSL